MRFRHLALGGAVCLWAAAGIGAATTASLFRLPSQARKPLPEAFVSLDSRAGLDLLRAAPRLDYDVLAPHFVPQQRPEWSAPAAVAIARNALAPAGRLIAQDEVFAQVGDPASPLITTWRGATLPEVARMADANGLHASVHYAEDATARAFSDRLASDAEDASDVLLLDLDRRVLGLAGGRHVALVGAYDAATDRVLVLETASHHYPSAWVPAASLFDAMMATDPRTGQSGGWISVRTAERVVSRTHAGAAWSARGYRAR
jgi:hypothetical protein